MEARIDWQQLGRFLAGECSAEEQRKVKAWIATDLRHARLVDELRHIWTTAEALPTGLMGELDVDADWEALHEKVRAMEEDTPASDRRVRRPGHVARDRGPATRRPRRRPLLSRAVRVAVVCLLLVGGTWAAVHWWSGPGAPGSMMREIVTERGERAELLLADGTQVTLNVDSRLRLPDTFGRQGTREVYLQGEAYFEVAPDASRPFIVHAGEAVIHVTGTAFDVEAYPEGSRVQVVVTEGTVLLRSAQKAKEQAVKLQRGELGRLADGASEVATRQVDVQTYLGWTEGRLVFKNATLSEVATRLERWYDVECEIRDASLGSLHLTANLQGQALRDVLDIITASLGITYRMEDKTVVLMNE